MTENEQGAIDPSVQRLIDSASSFKGWEDLGATEWWDDVLHQSRELTARLTPSEQTHDQGMDLVLTAVRQRMHGWFGWGSEDEQLVDDIRKQIEHDLRVSRIGFCNTEANHD